MVYVIEHKFSLNKKKRTMVEDFHTWTGLMDYDYHELEYASKQFKLWSKVSQIKFNWPVDN